LLKGWYNFGMKVYFVRHGESVGNKANLHQTSEMPLSDTGITQAKRIAKRLKKFKIDYILASPVIRARQTAGIISASLNVPIEEWEELAEVKGPTELKGKSYADPKVSAIKKLIRENYVKGNWKYSDEENYEEINFRAGKLLNHLVKDHFNDDVICVSHATYIKFLVAKMLFGDNLKPEISHIFYHHFLMQNTGLTVCEYDKENGWLIRHLNDASHL
jgi:broad specificity phosphatase PhoE